MKVYLDNSATTALDKRVLDKMKPFMTNEYGNASSIHCMGQEAAATLDNARKTVAEILNADTENIIFTGSATESNNLIITGVARANKEKGNHILISQFEHPSVIEPAEQLKKEDFEIEFIPITPEGFIDIGKFKALLRPETILVSIMTVNSEIGTIQDIKELSKITHDAGALFHTDAVQAVPYCIPNVNDWNIDYLTLSSHKFNGPKGVGIAHINRKHKIQPIIMGGGQEFGIRAGTYNIPGIVGAAEAIRLTYKERKEYIAQVRTLRDHMWKRMQEEIEDVVLNGALEGRTPNNLNVRFERVEGEAILMELSTHDICVSTGSACSAENLKTSHVITALGTPEKYMNSNIRFTLGRTTTKEEIDYCILHLKETVRRLRELSPLKK